MWLCTTLRRGKAKGNKYTYWIIAGVSTREFCEEGIQSLGVCGGMLRGSIVSLKGIRRRSVDLILLLPLRLEILPGSS